MSSGSLPTKKKIIYILSLLLSIAGFFFRIEIMEAINILSEGYQVAPSTSTTIDARSYGGDCRVVTTPSGSLSNFVATKTLNEWNSFKWTAPSRGVQLGTCSSGCTQYLKRVGENWDDGIYSLEALPDQSMIVAGFHVGNSNLLEMGTLTGSASWGATYMRKLSSTGTLLWTKTAINYTGSGVSYDSIDTDAAGNIYVVGAYAGTSANIFGTLFSSPAGAYNGNIFYAKLDSSGNPLWVKSSSGYTAGVLVEPDGSMYIYGGFNGTKNIFGTIMTSSGSPSNGENDIYIARVDTSGNTTWVIRGSATPGGRSASDDIISIDDDATHLYLVGRYAENGTVFGSNVTWTYGIDNFGDGYFAKIAKSNGALSWIKIAQSLGQDNAFSIRVLPNGNIITGGVIGDAISTIYGQSLNTSSGLSYIMIFNPSGTLLNTYQTIPGGANAGSIGSMDIDSAGNIYIAGSASGTNVNLFGSTLASVRGQFMAKLNPSVSGLWSQAVINDTFGGTAVFVTPAGDIRSVFNANDGSINYYGLTRTYSNYPSLFGHFDTNGNYLCY